MSGYLDIHCHILPGVDDGPSTVDAAVRLLDGMAELGFREIYPTPHHRPGLWTPTTLQTDEARSLLLQAIDQRSPPAGQGDAVPLVHRAAREHLLDESLLAPQEEGLTLYPGDHAFLVEFSGGGPPPNLEERLFEFRLRGLLPVIAHVERYPTLTNDTRRIESLANVAALLVNLSSLGGWWWGRAARKLVKERRVHAGTTDAHGLPDLHACRKGIQWIRSTLGDEGTEQLLLENPRQILAGELPER